MSPASSQTTDTAWAGEMPQPLETRLTTKSIRKDAWPGYRAYGEEQGPKASLLNFVNTPAAHDLYLPLCLYLLLYLQERTRDPRANKTPSLIQGISRRTF